MKSWMFLLVTVFLFVISCDKPIEDIVDDENDWTQPSIELVKLDSDLSKVSNSVGDISFGDIVSTKTFFYMLVNNGESEVFNINLSSDSVIVEPNNISVIVGTSDLGVSSVPIISVTVPHVLPPEEVGNYLPYTLGDFIDILSVDYQYVGVQGDTISETKSWDVSGNRLGGMVDFLIDGQNYESIMSLFNLGWNQSDGQPFSVIRYIDPDPNTDSKIIVNTGNVELFFEVFSGVHPSVVLDDPVHTDTILPGDSLDVSSVLPGLDLNLFRLSTPNTLFKVYNRVIKYGLCQFKIEV